MLGAFGQVDAIEIDEAARDIASQRLGHAGDERAAARAGRASATGAYDLIAMLDVLEHVEEDREALRQPGREARSPAAGS